MSEKAVLRAHRYMINCIQAAKNVQIFCLGPCVTQKKMRKKRGKKYSSGTIVIDKCMHLFEQRKPFFNISFCIPLNASLSIFCNKKTSLRTGYRAEPLLQKKLLNTHIVSFINTKYSKYSR
mgnify:CR=1 FL=1